MNDIFISKRLSVFVRLFVFLPTIWSIFGHAEKQSERNQQRESFLIHIKLSGKIWFADFLNHQTQNTIKLRFAGQEMDGDDSRNELQVVISNGYLKWLTAYE